MTSSATQPLDRVLARFYTKPHPPRPWYDFYTDILHFNTHFLNPMVYFTEKKKKRKKHLFRHQLPSTKENTTYSHPPQ